MNVLLDVQSELSLPDGGCGTEALVRRAAELGLTGLALADRGTLAAAPAFIRAARTAGIEPRVGVRIPVGGAEDLDLLVFPRRPEALSAIGQLAGVESLSASDLEKAGGAEALIGLAVVSPPSSGNGAALERLRAPLRSLLSVLRPGGLALAIPNAHSSMLVELGRELALQNVLTPPVHIVEAEHALLHRLLVLIRGDHESGGDAPRPGRPAPAPGSLVGAASQIKSVAEPRETSAREAARDFLNQLAPPDGLIEPPLPDLVRESEEMALLRERLLAVCAASRQLPASSRLNAEIEALSRSRAVAPVLRLVEIIRSLGERVHLGVAAGWRESWIGWTLGLSGAPPSPSGPAPAWVEDHGPLPAADLEMGEAGARAARVLLELAGARRPLSIRRLTAAEAVRWLAQERGFDATAIRRMVATVEGRAPDKRPPKGARSVISLAVKLAGHVVGIEPDVAIRVWSPFSASGRCLDRLTADATASGGLVVRVTASTTLTILERAGVGGVVGGSGAVAWSDLADLLAGPLAGRGGGAFARVLSQRKPETISELARCLALSTRPPDAPSPRLPGPPSDLAPARQELVFHADVITVLRAHGIADETAHDLLKRAATGRGALVAALRPSLLRELDAAGEPPERAEAILGALVRIVPHLEEEGVWLARARALAALGDLARGATPPLAAIMADLLPARLQAITTWAEARGVAFLRADLNASQVDSHVAGAQGTGTLVRLGLVHMAGLDRATAEVVAGVRGDRPFANRNELVRRLRHRIPEQRLKALAGEVAAGSSESGAADIIAPARKRRRRADSADPSIHDYPSIQSVPQQSLPLSRRSAPRGPVIPGGRRGQGAAHPLDTGRDLMQFDLFGAPISSPRIFTAALSRYGILSLDRAAGAPAGSRVRTVGVIRALRGMVTRAGRHLAAARLEDGGTALELLLLPRLLDSAEDLPLGRPVVVEGRVAPREGRSEITVESAVPLELLSRVAQPALEIVLPAGFRRMRALKLRLLQSPGRSPLRVRTRGRERAAVAAAEGLSRLGVTPDDALLADLRGMVGAANAYLVGAPAEQSGVDPDSAAAATAGAA